MVIRLFLPVVAMVVTAGPSVSCEMV